MRTKGFYYSDFGFNYGKSISLPDFYQTSFHTHDYIRREWGKHFDVLDIQPLAAPATPGHRAPAESIVGRAP